MSITPLLSPRLGFAPVLLFAAKWFVALEASLPLSLSPSFSSFSFHLIFTQTPLSLSRARPRTRPRPRAAAGRGKRRGRGARVRSRAWPARGRAARARTRLRRHCARELVQQIARGESEAAGEERAGRRSGDRGARRVHGAPRRGEWRHARPRSRPLGARACRCLGLSSRLRQVSFCSPLHFTRIVHTV